MTTMGTITWDPALETGHDRVDAQHRQLVETFNQLYDAAVLEHARQDEVIDDVLGRLVEYIRTHFADEEGLMAATAYDPDAVAVHIAAHTDLASRTMDMVEQRERGEITDVMPLATFLNEWLAEHVRRMDRTLIDHVRSRASSAG
jgi:hemerythrin